MLVSVPQLAADLPEADLVVGFQNYGNLALSLQRSMDIEPTAEALALGEASEAQQRGEQPPERTQAREGTQGQAGMEAGTSSQRVQVR